MVQLSFMFDATKEYKEVWMFGEKGLPRAAEIFVTLLTAQIPIVTFSAVAKQALNLTLESDIPEDLTQLHADMKNALRDNRADLKDLLQEQGWLLVACDHHGKPALGKSGGKAEGFALMASPTGDVHTGQQVLMALANAEAAVHSRRVAGLIDGKHEQEALQVLDQFRLLLMPPAEVEPVS